MADVPLEWPEAFMKIARPGQMQPKVSKPGKIRVTPGKIELVMEKETILIKSSELMIPKIAQTGRRFSLDFIQSGRHKYQFIILDLGESASKEEVREMYEVVMHAWTATKQDLYADEIAVPIHKRPPNAGISREQNRVPTARDRNKIAVDQPDDNTGNVSTHGQFNSDFQEDKRSKTKEGALNESMKAMFDEYEIGEKKSSSMSAVHKKIPPKKPPPKTISYAEQAKKAQPDKGEYKCVDKKMDELDSSSFYGGPSPLAQSYTRKNQIGSGRLSSKDSIDEAARQSRYRSSISHNSISKQNMRDIRDDNDEFDDGNNDYMGFRENRENEPTASAKRPSLTSQASMATFDRIMGRPSNLPPLLSRTQQNDHYLTSTKPVNSQYKSPMLSNSNWSFGSGGGDGPAKTGVYPFKRMENIGNSCYMNSTLQILAACPLFLQQAETALASITNTDNTLISPLMEMLRILNNNADRQYWSGPSRDTLTNMRDILLKKHAAFEEGGGGRQQDAEECLTVILGAISSECTGLAMRRRDSDVHNSSSQSMKSPAERRPSSAMDERKKEKRGKAPAVCDPVDLMVVQTRTERICQHNTSHKQHEYERHERVHVEVESEAASGVAWAATDLPQLISAQRRIGEIVDYKCEKCDKKVILTDQKQFLKFGEYVIIVLKRYNDRNKKVQTPVRIPLYLDLNKYLTEKDETEELEKASDVTIDVESMETEEVRRPHVVKLMKETEEWMEEKKEEKEKKNAEPVENLTQKMNESGDLLGEKENEKKEEDEVEEDVEMFEDYGGGDIGESSMDLPPLSSSIPSTPIRRSSILDKLDKEHEKIVMESGKKLSKMRKEEEEEEEAEKEEEEEEKEKEEEEKEEGKEEKRKSEEGEEKIPETPSTRKRTRGMVKNGAEKATRSSGIISSDPPRRAKQSRLSPRRRNVSESSASSGDIVIEEHLRKTRVKKEEEKAKPSPISIIKPAKPVWQSTEEERAKRRSLSAMGSSGEKEKKDEEEDKNDPFAFFDDEEGRDDSVTGGKRGRGSRGGRGRGVQRGRRSGRPSPLKPTNRRKSKESVSPPSSRSVTPKSSDKKAEKVQSAMKKEMEQTGGARRRIVSSSEEEDEEMEQEKKRVPANPKAKRIIKKGDDEKKEEEEDKTQSSTDSGRGNNTTEDDEEVSSTERVVPATPPDAMEEDEERKKEEIEVGRDGDDEEKMEEDEDKSGPIDEEEEEEDDDPTQSHLAAMFEQDMDGGEDEMEDKKGDEQGDEDKEKKKDEVESEDEEKKKEKLREKMRRSAEVKKMIEEEERKKEEEEAEERRMRRKKREERDAEREKEKEKKEERRRSEENSDGKMANIEDVKLLSDDEEKEEKSMKEEECEIPNESAVFDKTREDCHPVVTIDEEEDETKDEGEKKKDDEGKEKKDKDGDELIDLFEDDEKKQERMKDPFEIFSSPELRKKTEEFPKRDQRRNFMPPTREKGKAVTRVIGMDDYENGVTMGRKTRAMTKKEDEETRKMRGEWRDDEEENKDTGEADGLSLEERNDITRSLWRDIFVETEDLPSQDLFMFRPVDERWMRSQCKLWGMDFKGAIGQSKSDLDSLRAQTNLCKRTDAPGDMIEIDGDGNCMFRSLAWYITGSEDQHREIRKMLVKFMCKFPEEFGAVMTGEAGQLYTIKDNLRMLELGEWGTQCEIFGAATMFGVDIHTYHQGTWKTYRPLFDWTESNGIKKMETSRRKDARTRFGIYLNNVANMHYDVVKYMKPAPPKEDSYRLISTIQHKGTTSGTGHYVADIYDEKKDQWVNCDDQNIKKITVLEMLTNAMKEGYVLVYAKQMKEKKMKNEEK